MSSRHLPKIAHSRSIPLLLQPSNTEITKVFLVLEEFAIAVGGFRGIWRLVEKVRFEVFTFGAKRVPPVDTILYASISAARATPADRPMASAAIVSALIVVTHRSAEVFFAPAPTSQSPRLICRRPSRLHRSLSHIAIIPMSAAEPRPWRKTRAGRWKMKSPEIRREESASQPVKAAKSSKSK